MAVYIIAVALRRRFQVELSDDSVFTLAHLVQTLYRYYANLKREKWCQARGQVGHSSFRVYIEMLQLVIYRKANEAEG
jgi:hypothetical protein